MVIRALVFTMAIGALTALGAPRPVHDLLVYNPSPSIEVGFYVRIEVEPALSDIVTVRAADVAPGEARLRHFDGGGDRFIKRVAARGGDIVCALNAEVRINGEMAAVRRATDSSGRPLRRWRGCRALAGDEYFLLGAALGSFDSRYWGPVRRSQIEGVWRPL